MAVVVNQSRAKAWRQCRQQHAYKFQEKLVRKRTRRPLQFGSMVHSLIEAHAEGNDPFAVLDDMEKRHGKMFRAEREEYGDIVHDVRLIMIDYFDHWAKSGLKYLRRAKKRSEHYFEIELEKGIIFKGTMDAIGKANDLRWLVEHKTFTRMPTEDHRWRNLQSSVYIRANDLMGWKGLDGTLWDYIRSKPPAMPEILQSGKLSHRKIDSLPSAIVQFIQDKGLNLDDHEAFIGLIANNRSSYFSRIFTPLSREVVDIVFDDFVTTAREIAEHQDRRPVRNIGLHCDYCDFEPLCRAALQGSDVDFVKKREFRKDEKATGKGPKG